MGEDDPLAEALRLLEQAGLTRAYAAGVGGVVGPVVRPLTWFPLLSAQMDAGMTELSQQVIALAEARVSIQAHKPGVHIQGEVIAPLPGDLITRVSRVSGKAAEPGIITTRRMLNVLICLIAFWLLQTYTELSSKDQNFLLAAIAIGSMAWQASDHFKPGG